MARRERIRGQLTTVSIARVLEDLATLEDLAVPVVLVTETGGQTW